MPSDVDLCNLALSHLGGEALVGSLNPPDGTIEARLCALHYAPARDALLALHPWGFATTRVNGTLLAGQGNDAWTYALARPAQTLRVLAVLPPGASDDDPAAPQPFVCELTADGDEAVFTNQEQAVLRVVKRVQDTSRFPPLFAEALSWLLASKLAGPLYKGDSGAKMAKACLEAFSLWFPRAQAADAAQRGGKLLFTPSFLAARA